MDLAVKCNKCGNWNAKPNITDLSKAVLKCKFCEKGTKLRYKGGWNVKFGVPKRNETLAEAVQRFKRDE